MIALPRPPATLGLGLAEALDARRTGYRTATAALAPEALSALLGWGVGLSRTVPAYGLPEHPLLRSPMPGGVDALRVGVAVRGVEGIPPGVYGYAPVPHALEPRGGASARTALVAACTQAELVADRCAVLVLATELAAGEHKYGPQFAANAAIGVGGALQSLHLVATALGLDAGSLTGVDREAVADAIGVDADASPVVALFGVSRVD